jgi:hypothetical protein
LSPQSQLQVEYDKGIEKVYLDAARVIAAEPELGDLESWIEVADRAKEICTLAKNNDTSQDGGPAL